ncbi:MAG: DUF5928 domain-containing protein [Gemmobacter sp.]
MIQPFGPMARIAHLLLCHQNPEGIAAQARLLAAQGDFVAIHFDAGAARADFARLRAALADAPRIVLVERRHRCGWGSWSLVAATLATARRALGAFPEATHFMLLSGDCWPIMPVRQIRAHLDADGRDRIECADFLTSGWIRTGLVEERLLYRHPFNERTQRRLFYAGLWVQRRLGLRRALPARLRIRIGSQWWCLRRQTLERVLDFGAKRRDVVRFFRTTWIPDETYVQTLVHHLVPEAEIDARPPTFLGFTDYGMPVVFHDDHYDLLVRQDHFFARKISPNAHRLNERLRALHADPVAEVPALHDGHASIAYLRRLGREGLRAAQPAWERDGALGPEHALFVIVSKKWHVAKRLRDGLARLGGFCALGFVFSEAEAHLPDLGGIGADPARRADHPVALLRLVAEVARARRIALCLDPGQTGVLEALVASGARLRVLWLDARLSDAYLAGHAARLGLVGADGGAVAAEMLEGLRRECVAEGERLRRICGPALRVWTEGTPPARIAPVLAETFDLVDTDAEALARAPHLFED